MAFEIQQINPLDTRPSIGVGVTLPFSSKSVFTTSYTTADALKSNLVNYLLTDKGERFLNPDFGANLRRLLFSQSTSDLVEEVKAVIRSGIATWFPNVVIEQIQVKELVDNNQFQVSIIYRVDMTNIQDQLVINFEQ
tara:strand:- start:769 stop:1179 length:411 start_codon:yes stop_codon:yes gene_type:complete